MFKNHKTHQQVYIAISDPISVDHLHHFKERQDPRYYCEDFARQTLEDEEFFMISSRIYCKRSNLLNDKASWAGWEVHMRTSTRDIMVILMRRKYIPPILDTF